MSEAREYRVAVVPGDGIGREVIPEGIKVLDALVAGRDDGLSFTYDYYPWGAQYYLEAGVIMDDGGLDLLREVDAIYFGAAGWPEVPDHLQLYGFRLVVCRGFDLFASVRPIKLFPGVTGPIRDTTPDNVDFVVVRENSEGEYAGNGGRNLSGRGAGKEIALETSIFTEEGCERILRYGFEVARRRPRKKLASITKSNALQYGMSLWDDCYERVRQDYPDVESEQVLVDAMAARMVLRPDSLDVLVASNLFGDILSDSSAGVLEGASALRPAAISIHSTGIRACSSRSMVRRQTSPERGSPTRLPQSGLRP